MNFNEKWSKAKSFFVVNNIEFSITEIENSHTRCLYEDMKYRFGTYFTLQEAKNAVKKLKQYTPEGHTIKDWKPLKEYKIISLTPNSRL